MTLRAISDTAFLNPDLDSGHGSSSEENPLTHDTQMVQEFLRLCNLTYARQDEVYPLRVAGHKVTLRATVDTGSMISTMAAATAYYLVKYCPKSIKIVNHEPKVFTTICKTQTGSFLRSAILYFYTNRSEHLGHNYRFAIIDEMDTLILLALQRDLLNKDFRNTNIHHSRRIPNSDDYVPPRTTAREILRSPIQTRLRSKLTNFVTPSDTNLISDISADPVSGSIVELNGIPIEPDSQLDGVNIPTPPDHPPNYVSISSVSGGDPVISNISSDTMPRLFDESNYYAPTSTDSRESSPPSLFSERLSDINMRPKLPGHEPRVNESERIPTFFNSPPLEQNKTNCTSVSPPLNRISSNLNSTGDDQLISVQSNIPKDSTLSHAGLQTPAKVAAPTISPGSPEFNEPESVTVHSPLNELVPATNIH
ncbi:unnamed protein product [Allacma fusca]|uniref:Uncharacterized protein n=1 Tax=Allacma fusca TaxID=39272 RepID=A0A8J2KD91_9HEXA|nr:unnamed protein product [Allacma fusca]